MLEDVKTDDLRLRNPHHHFPDHVQTGLDHIGLQRADALVNRDLVLSASRPNADERRVMRELEAEGQSVNFDKAKKLLRDYSERVRPFNMADLSGTLPEMDWSPRAVDNTFWWAETQAWSSGGIGAQFLTDGLHFFGRRSYDSDPLFSFSVGATARFVISPDRRPPSASGRYLSFPYVELYGSINGWTNLQHCPWFCDDKWCKCFLFLRQSAVQFVDDAGNWTLVGEATSHRTLINEEGNGVGVQAPMPGHLPIPPLNFGLARPDRDIIIDIEVRFDIQLEGDSFIGFSPGDNPANSVVLRHFQWPCLAA